MNTEPLKVLLIDDNPGDAVLVRETLYSQSNMTLQIEHGERLAAGIAMLREKVYNIILLDLTLPDCSGLDTFVRIKPHARDIPIIILTGVNNEEIAVQAVGKGAQDYIVKDEMNTGLLVRSISYAIERSKAEEKRRWLETKMLHAQKLESLSVLSGGVAHNFNSLLTAIIGNAELALEKLSKESIATPNVERIVSSAKRASELANKMLAYSGKGRFVIETLNISNLIKEMKSIIASTVSKNVRVHYQLSSDIPFIKADVPQIQQVILNLVLNASEAIGEQQGTITIRTQKIIADKAWLQKGNLHEELLPGSFAQLGIDDTGIGISEEVKAKIFEPFFTTKFTGRGLGLAAVQGIIRGHSGAVTIVSEQGKGTKLEILFPHVEEDCFEVSKKYPRKINHQQCVLFVEDEQDIIEITKERMENSGLKVLIAKDNTEALDIFNEHKDKIDVVILDVPKMEWGIRKVIQRIQKGKPNVGVIITSDYDKKTSFGQFNELKINGVIKKPYYWKELFDMIGKVLP